MSAIALICYSLYQMAIGWDRMHPLASRGWADQLCFQFIPLYPDRIFHVLLANRVHPVLVGAPFQKQIF